MRVLVLSEMFPRPADPVSGRFVLSQLKALSGQGIGFSVISPVPYSPRLLWHNAKWRRYGQIPRGAIWQSIEARYPRYPRIPGKFYRKFEPFAMFPSLCASFRVRSRERPFDLIHAHGLLPCGMAAILLSKTFRIPCICHARGSDVNLYPQESKANFLLTKYVIDHCDAPAAVSQDLANKMIRISGNSRRITVLYTTVDMGLFQPPGDKGALRERLGISAQSFVCIYVGHLGHQKGIGDLARAWPRIKEQLPGSLLVVIGDGPLRGELSGVGPSVSLCGRRPHNEVAQWMRASDVLVLPSYNEGLPNVVAEAMACGLPVVATSVGGIPEAVIHGQTGILTPVGDRSALVSAITALGRDEGGRRSMGEAGRKRALAMFQADIYAARAQKLYSSLIGRAACTGGD